MFDIGIGRDYSGLYTVWSGRSEERGLGGRITVEVMNFVKGFRIIYKSII